MSEIGFAISLYDKYTDLEILVDIIRSWKHEYKISVCCSHDLIRSLIRKMDVDNVCKPRHVAQLGMHNNSKINKYAQNIRCTESVRASCKALEDVEYGIHLHSDAWYLSESVMLGLMGILQQDGYRVATRGHGLEDAFNPFRQGVFGTVDDHGIMWDVDWCKRHHVWDFKPEAMMYHKYGVHSQLALLFGVKVGLDNWLYYNSNCLDAFGNSTKSLSPVNFDTVSDMLHVNVDALPEYWGRAIQEAYLSEYGYNMLSDFHDDDVFDRLAAHNKKYNRLLSLCGYSQKRLSAISPVHKERFLREMTAVKIFDNYRHRIVDYVLDLIFKSPIDITDWYQRNGYIDGLVGKDNWTRRVY